MALALPTGSKFLTLSQLTVYNSNIVGRIWWVSGMGAAISALAKSQWCRKLSPNWRYLQSSVFLVVDKLSTRRRAFGLVLAGRNGEFSFSNVLFRAIALFQVRIQGPRLPLFGRHAFRPLAVCGQQQWKRLLRLTGSSTTTLSTLPASLRPQ